MATLTFNNKQLRSLLTLADTDKVAFAKDHGIYLVGCKANDDNVVIYGRGFNPLTNDLWYDKANILWGDDDFGLELGEFAQFRGRIEDGCAIRIKATQTKFIVDWLLPTPTSKNDPQPKAKAPKAAPKKAATKKQVEDQASKLNKALPSSVNRPKAGTVCAEVWATCDTYKDLPRKEVIQICINAGINAATARTQYQRWFSAQ